MITEDVLSDLLIGIQKPGRYIDGEWNSQKKDRTDIKTKIALVFPDLYEIGMSYLGQKILYSLLNSHPEISAERVFAPWGDFEQRLRSQEVPLFSLETRTPLKDFDLVGFSLLYELNYSNILTMLDLSQIPLLARNREEGHPFVIAGGPAAVNPEPVAEIFDLIFIGDGEQAFFELIDKIHTLREKGMSRQEVLGELTGMKSFYVPSLYRTVRSGKKSLFSVIPEGHAPPRISKRVLFPFKESHFPEDIIVPNIETVFDRTSIEIARGCVEKCRFCQASSVYFPPRIKDPDYVQRTLSESISSTGYESASLSALSAGDYPYLEQLTGGLMDELEERHVSLSLSSLRPKGLTTSIVKNILRVKKTGFTLVPEAGTARLRRVINKSMNEEEIINAAVSAFENGWRLIKLYFMVGLPTERQDDLDGIVRLIEEIITRGKKILRTFPRINLSVSSFIPKPHTPFQWEGMESEELLKEKHAYLVARLKKYRSVKFKKHSVKRSVLEAVLSRGDRRLNRVIHRAWKNGARFDSWDDRFRFSIWEKSFMEEGIDPQEFLVPLDPADILPWDHIDIGIKRAFLLEEKLKAYREEVTPSCRDVSCGDCQGCTLQHMLGKEHPPWKSVSSKRSTKIGQEAKTARRYRVTYEKRGLARFLSHQDVLNILQRSLRRAGISVVYSQGFHPKMKISHLPALPLGMEGIDEKFEFKSDEIISEKSFLRKMNFLLPSGLRFLALEECREGQPSLGEEIMGFIYSVDVASKALRGSIRRSSEERPTEKTQDEDIHKRIEDYMASKSQDNIRQVKYHRDAAKISILTIQSGNKQTRPQDVVRSLFQTEHPVYAMSRDKSLVRKSET